MGLFELHNAKIYCLGSGVAPQTPIPLYTIGKQRCFWLPRMGVFELHNAKKCCLGSGLAPQTPISLYPLASKGVCGYLGWGCFELHDAKKLFGFWGGALNTHTSVP